MKRIVLRMLVMVGVFSFWATPASAVITYNPDPPVAGQALTITNSVEWAGCTQSNWNYTQTVTLVAPDGTETVFSVISESGTAAAPAQTLTGSDTQILPAVAGDYTVRISTRIFCGRLGQASTSLGSVSVAEDASVPVADPLVALGSIAVIGLGFGILNRRRDCQQVAA